jgi:hypothetical protein
MYYSNIYIFQQDGQSGTDFTKNRKSDTENATMRLLDNSKVQILILYKFILNIERNKKTKNKTLRLGVNSERASVPEPC